MKYNPYFYQPMNNFYTRACPFYPYSCFFRNDVRILPPQYTLWKEIKYTLERDPQVKVLDLVVATHPYLVRIIVDDQKKGEALATILKPQYQIGNIMINIIVQNSDVKAYETRFVNTAEELAILAKEAFGGNILFVNAVIQNFFSIDQVFLVFTPRIIQFFNDDLSDLFGNYNEVAAKVFQSLVNGEINNIPTLCSTNKV